MGDLVNDLHITDIIPSFAPTRSDTPLHVPPIDITRTDVDPADSPGSTGNSTNNNPPTPTTTTTTTKPGSSNGAGDAGTNRDTDDGSNAGTNNPGTTTTTNGNNNNITVKPVKNNNLSLQPKPGALVGTTGNSNTSPKSNNNNSVDGAGISGGSGDGVGGAVPVGAILGSVLAGVIMVTLAVTLLVALRRKNRRNSGAEPVVRSRLGRLGLAEKGIEHEDDKIWDAKDDTKKGAPQLSALNLRSDSTELPTFSENSPSSSSSLGKFPSFKTNIPHDAVPLPNASFSHQVHQSISQQRPDSVGSIQDAPMNYVVALEERAPRFDLRVINRASHSSEAE